MAFVLTTSATYEWPVEVKVPKSDGSFDVFDFVGEFKRISQSRFEAIVEGVRTGKVSDDSLIDEFFVGWSGIEDEQGNVLQVTKKNRQMLLEIIRMKPAVINAFFQCVRGIERKNS